MHTFSLLCIAFIYMNPAVAGWVRSCAWTAQLDSIYVKVFQSGQDGQQQPASNWDNKSTRGSHSVLRCWLQASHSSPFTLAHTFQVCWGGSAHFNAHPGWQADSAHVCWVHINTRLSGLPHKSFLRKLLEGNLALQLFSYNWNDGSLIFALLASDVLVTLFILYFECLCFQAIMVF